MNKPEQTQAVDKTTAREKRQPDKQFCFKFNLTFLFFRL
jgi:hypothetical protein